MPAAGPPNLPQTPGATVGSLLGVWGRCTTPGAGNASLDFRSILMLAARGGGRPVLGVPEAQDRVEDERQEDQPEGEARPLAEIRGHARDGEDGDDDVDDGDEHEQ